MKRIIPVTLAVALSILALSHRSRADAAVTHAVVPFAFSIGSELFPPGTYNIAHKGAFVQFQSIDGRSGTLLAPLVGSASKDGQSRLFFDVTNHQHFLRRIVTPNSSGSMDFPKSRLEKQEESVERIDVLNAMDAAIEPMRP